MVHSHSRIRSLSLVLSKVRTRSHDWVLSVASVSLSRLGTLGNSDLVHSLLLVLSDRWIRSAFMMLSSIQDSFRSVAFGAVPSVDSFIGDGALRLLDSLVFAGAFIYDGSLRCFDAVPTDDSLGWAGTLILNDSLAIFDTLWFSALVPAQ